MASKLPLLLTSLKTKLPIESGCQKPKSAVRLLSASGVRSVKPGVAGSPTGSVPPLSETAPERIK